MIETIIFSDSISAVSGTHVNTVGSAKVGYCQAG
jgi:hypothetical protein